jgi:hypothetical protein
MDAAHFSLVVIEWTMKLDPEAESKKFLMLKKTYLNTNHILDSPGMNNEPENSAIMQ